MVFGQWTVVDKKQHRRVIYHFLREDFPLIDFVEIKFVGIEGWRDGVELFGLAPLGRSIFIELKLNISVITSHNFRRNLVKDFLTCTKNLKFPSSTFSRVTFNLYRKTSALLFSQSCHLAFNSSTNVLSITSAIGNKFEGNFGQ